MVPLNMTYLHCLPHSLFEHLFNLYCLVMVVLNIAGQMATHVTGNYYFISIQIISTVKRYTVLTSI